MVKYIYKNKESEAKMHDFYDTALAALDVMYEEQIINTSYGSTHLLIVGDKLKPPLFTLHGGNGINPLNLKLFLPLLDNYCIYAPDVIGMPGKSTPYRNLSPSKDDYGWWISELLEALRFNSMMFVVSSYSSAMMLSLAKVDPGKITKAVLLAPSGIAHGSLLPIFTKMMIPMMTYMLRPSKERLVKIFDPMLTEKDVLWYQFFNLLLTCYKMEMRAPREFKRKELNGYSSPLLIICAADDIFFPPHKVFTKARTVLGGCDIKEMIIKGKHLPTAEIMCNVCKEIDQLFKEVHEHQ
ncbi:MULTISPECIES: alpha/beta fold hydrolase [Paenibacillus]|uniref:AB hydrolase-1 domain-containing protein n=1 Tax=Paenibacillus borealis TaxID=160799 RepID=A0ABX3H6V4_PAEBO|nr:alpha/beta fold hydrolase [Paenibacillus borealis]OMD44750.1 hypothetical protein BSK56_21875 [Paenibacillus borealis]